MCTKLNTIQSIIGNEVQKVLVKFTITMYDKSSQAKAVDAVPPGNKVI